MGIITEYIKAIQQGLKHPELVVEGWLNDIKLEKGELPDDEVKEILRRRVICESCPFMSRNAVAAGNYYTERKDDHCIHCKCPIKKKTASLESNCGIEIYNQANKNKQIELKWTNYIKNDIND
jgi:hypothetical protein